MRRQAPRPLSVPPRHGETIEREKLRQSETHAPQRLRAARIATFENRTSRSHLIVGKLRAQVREARTHLRCCKKKQKNVI